MGQVTPVPDGFGLRFMLSTVFLPHETTDDGEKVGEKTEDVHFTLNLKWFREQGLLIQRHRI